MVHIRPKGPVPVLALEWQISNEVPNNLAALKRAAESVTPQYAEVSKAQVIGSRCFFVLSSRLVTTCWSCIIFLYPLARA